MTHRVYFVLPQTQQLAAAAEREYAEAARALARTKHSAKLKESALVSSSKVYIDVVLLAGNLNQC